MIIYCCGCEAPTLPRLTDGKEIYPHRKDLFKLPFWKCDKCGNFVGCHHKTNTPTKPLGCIPTPEIKKHRQALHQIIDPIWCNGKIGRKALYKRISDALGKTYHAADLKSVGECREAYKAIEQVKCDIKYELGMGGNHD